ncbi:nuclear body protein SP140-like protein isoform X3 [Notamacropus eugenii]|uniref:nuclear body protein SP140-like protein isoform X3 n=1 Tax=Notamacropus eugenii TaxID=9315 RepID=UPI003B66BA03
MVKDKLLETFRENKLEISKAVTTPFPFLNILRNYSLISDQMYQSARMEYQELDPTEEGYLCTYDILMELEKKFSTKILAALFDPINLKQYPSLVQIQKHFKDVPLDESASETSGGFPVQRSSLDERESAVNAPQSSVQATELRIQKEAVVSRKAKGPKIDFHGHELPVTCGAAHGTLYKTKMKKGSSEKCINMADGTWLTLKEFEIKGGRGAAKNWKKSIHCGSHTLHYLMEKKGLPCPPTTYAKRKKTLPAGKTKGLPKTKKRTTLCRATPARLQPCQKRQLAASEPPTEVGTLSNQSPPVRRESCTTGPWKDGPLLQKPRKTHLHRSWPPARRRVISLANQPKYRAQLQARKWISVRCKTGVGRLYKKRFATVYKGKCILTERGWCTPLKFLAKDPAFNIATWTHSIHSGRLTLQTLIESDIMKLHSDSCSCVLCKEKNTYPENDEDCFMCREEGDLFYCNSCPKSFHSNCHIPSISSESSEEWNCTFCKMRKNKEEEKKEGPKNNPCPRDTEVLKQRMYPEQLLKCEFLLMKMYHYSESFLFAVDPRLYKAYSPHVREPMWLDQVKKRLSNGTYNTVAGFVLDMRLIFCNAKKFNKSSAQHPAQSRHLINVD